jgi:CRISPR-associated exonuclease Cas4
MQPAASEDDMIMLSALQHYLFCPRQCALIHVEQQWAENRFTAEGRVLHERVDKPLAEKRRGVRTLTALPVLSFALGVRGVADAVEMPEGKPPFPVEYKRGKPKSHRSDEVQLCAQAIALEEMFSMPVPEGALFYGEPRRRTAVVFDAELRTLTHETANRARSMILGGITPAPVYEKRTCDSCSLLELCRPKTFEHPRSALAWLARAVED